MISYASIPLLLPTSEQRAWLDTWLSVSRLDDLSRPSWPSRNLTDLPFPFLDRQSPHALNSLHWPVGASRWAVGYFFATDAQLVLIRQAIGAPVYELGTASLSTGGIGYVVGDVITLTGGTPDTGDTFATLKVGTVNGGVITSVTEDDTGGYTSLPPNPVSVSGGSGSGATFTVTWINVSLAQTLIIDDGNNEPVITDLYMLPPRPIDQCFTSPPIPNQPLPAWYNGLWLVTLVDDRYHWWLRSADIDAPTGSSQWAQLFASLATALDITLTTDAIPAAYLNPPVDFMSRYDYLPLLLDAAAYSVGMRVVRNLDGTVSVQNATTAVAGWETGIGLPKVKGGQMLLSGLAASSGNPGPPNDVLEALPQNVAVAFPITRNSFPGCLPYFSNVPLASLGLPVLANVNTSALIDTRYFQSSCVAAYNTSGALDNQTEMDALAKQLATDWVLWQLAPLDVQFTGAIPWGPEGMHDVLWSHDSLPLTRVQRTPWNEWQQQVLHSSPTYGSAFYTQIAAVVQAASSSKTGNYYDAYVATTFNGSSPAFTTGQSAWLYDATGAAIISSGKEYPGCTLIGSYKNRPVYALAVGAGGSGGNGSTLIRVTSSSVDGTSQMYPGRVQAVTDGTPITWGDGIYCWAVAPNGGPLLASSPSEFYVGTFAIIHAADGKPVYFVAGTVINVVCIGGVVTGTTA